MILYFGQLWPKLQFSAAHVRTLGLVDQLIYKDYKITYITPQDTKKYTEPLSLEMKIFQADPNNPSRIDLVLKKLSDQPQIAIFDTHISEQFYSHYVHQLFPNCLKILDLQDWHCLRLKRHEDLKDGLNSSLTSVPLLGQDFEREMASIIVKFYNLIKRSDMILTCSDYEYKLLKKIVPHKNIQLITFFYPTQREEDENDRLKVIKQRDFSRRKNFVFLGNMAHEPNLDAIKYLIKNIWPLIKRKLPFANLHIYGSNFPSEITSNYDEGITCKGLMKEIEELGKYKVMLAPIRFGAGVKGKITDAWNEYLPVVTTPIGAEGLFLESILQQKYEVFHTIKSNFYKDQGNYVLFFLDPKNLSPESQFKLSNIEGLMNEYYEYNNKLLGQKLTFGGSFDNWSDEQFADEAVKLYDSEQLWTEAIDKGQKILQYRMDSKINQDWFLKAVHDTQINLGQQRKNDLMQRLAWSETMKSTYHFAKYLNEKRKNSQYIAQQRKQ